jgi:hypothetical protein
MMRNILAAAAILLLSALPANSQQQPVQPQQPIGGWNSPSGSEPRLFNTQDCRAEARRQAEARYPPRRINNRRGEITVENPGAFSAETSLFQECMRRKGG